MRKRTLANLTDWPSEKIEALRQVLKGAPAGVNCKDAFDIIRSRPHGHIAAVLGSGRRLGLHTMLGRTESRMRNIIIALFVARIIDPTSKLATVRGLRQGSQTRKFTH